VSISAYKSFNLAGIPLFTNISIPFTLQKPDLNLVKIPVINYYFDQRSLISDLIIIYAQL